VIIDVGNILIRCSFFFDSFPVCIEICEINLCVFLDLFQKERIDLDIFFAAVFVTRMLPCIFSWRARFIFQHTHRTATKPKTQNIRPHPTSKHVNITAAAASAPGNCRRRLSPPTEPPTTMMTTRDDHAEVPDQVAARSREWQGAEFYAPPPPRPGRRGRRRHGLGGPRPDVLRRWVPRSQWTAMARMVGIRSRRVIGVISR
jgi:hypothetical protein